MRAKLHSLSLCVLLVALSLVACGGDDNGDGGGTSTAPQRPTTTAAGAPKSFDGSWAGRTSQGKALSFTVANGAITQISVAYDYRGANCNVVNARTSGKLRNPPQINDGQFAIRAFGEDVFAGRFTSATQVSGRGHFRPTGQDQASCQVADFTWRARR